MKDITSTISRKTEELLKAGMGPAVSIFVQKGDEVILNQAYGYADVRKEIKATTDTLYNVGSMLKLMTASCIAKLHDQGKLDLQGTIADYLPVAFCEATNTGTLTIHQLLTHTAGLGLVFQNEEMKHREECIRSLYAACLGVKIVRSPNVKVEYSNYGYGLLGLIVEKVSRQPFEDFLAAYFLVPLGFENTTPISLDHNLEKQIAQPYVQKKGWFLPLERVVFKFFPAGEAYFKLSDYAKFIRLHTNKGMHEGKQILQTKTVEQMHQIHNIELEGTIYGYGCVGLPDKSVNIAKGDYGKGIFHTGGVSGYSCSYTTNEKGDYFILIALNSLWDFDEMYVLRDFCMRELNSLL